MANINSANVLKKITNNIRNNTNIQSRKNAVVLKNIQSVVDELIDLIISFSPTQIPLSKTDFITNVKIIDGNAEVDIVIPNGVKYRPSLNPEEYPNGVNIIQLFSLGYNAKSYTYGFWHGKMTRSKKERVGTNFMQSAINTFNESYGKKYNCIAYLSEDYKNN